MAIMTAPLTRSVTSAAAAEGETAAGVYRGPSVSGGVPRLSLLSLSLSLQRGGEEPTHQESRVLSGDLG